MSLVFNSGELKWRRPRSEAVSHLPIQFLFVVGWVGGRCG